MEHLQTSDVSVNALFLSRSWIRRKKNEEKSIGFSLCGGHGYWNDRLRRITDDRRVWKQQISLWFCKIIVVGPQRNA